MLIIEHIEFVVNNLTNNVMDMDLLWPHSPDIMLLSGTNSL